MACGIRLVEVKYPYTRSMSTRWDHSEYDPSRSPEHPDSWETPIIEECLTHSDTPLVSPYSEVLLFCRQLSRARRRNADLVK
ncbi:hypothetical protein TIFTF001_011354 [Ficus carica]|uniref:Uncharacterized protein n=1 Tax=Ficus carica TaxID=3494 RepID=A0AA87ZY42_FICCA|nr:hypothetical protein TIFTF001_011354 [Ficus carica]